MQCPEDGTTLQETDSSRGQDPRVPDVPRAVVRSRRTAAGQGQHRRRPALAGLRPLRREADGCGGQAEGASLSEDLIPMGVIPYEQSGVCMDKCSKCHGVWLSHGEFERIVEHLEKQVNSETAAQLEAEAAHQLGQVFTGREGPLSELRDLFSVLHLLRKRWAVEHPGLSETLDAISAGQARSGRDITSRCLVRTYSRGGPCDDYRDDH